MNPQKRDRYIEGVRAGNIYFGREENRSLVEIHHIDYDNIGDEKVCDTMVLCPDCHDRIHRFIDKMIAKGHKRRTVMKRIKPYCIRRILKTHDFWKRA